MTGVKPSQTYTENKDYLPGRPGFAQGFDPAGLPRQKIQRITMLGMRDIHKVSKRIMRNR
jgi:hypothetical protein